MNYAYGLTEELINLGFKPYSVNEGIYKFKDEKDIVYVAYWGSCKNGSGGFELVCIHDSVTKSMSKSVSSREGLREIFELVKKKASRELNLNKVLIE